MPTFILPPPSLSLSLSLSHLCIHKNPQSTLKHPQTSQNIPVHWLNSWLSIPRNAFLSLSLSLPPPSLPAGPPGWFSEKAGRCRSSQKPELICIIFAQRHLAHEMINSTISQNGMASISLGLTQHLGQCAVAPLILVIFSLNTSSF